MKIAYIGQKGIPMTQGGVEAHVENLAIKMAQKGHDVFVYARTYYSDKNIKKYRGVNLIFLPSIKSKHLDAITHTFLASVHSLFQNYDIIHYHSVGPSILSFIPRIFSKAKIIATFHCIDRFHQKWNKFAQLILKIGEWSICHFPHLTISVSPHIQSYCLKTYNRKTLFIPNGFKIKKNFNKNILKRYNLKSKKYFLAVSRLIKHKGLHYLIKAYQKINNLEYKLVIVGDTFYNQKYKTYLKNISERNKNIIFTGTLSNQNLDEIFTNAFSFILPSEDEGLSITLLEALAHQIPSIVSDIPANQQFIENNIVYSFKNKNIDDLKNQMENILKNKTKLLEKSKQAQKYVKNNFSWDNIVNQIATVYEKISKQNKKQIKNILSKTESYTLKI